MSTSLSPSLEPTLSPSAKWIWSDKSGEGRNIFCLFLRRFQLNAVPKEATLHLFADSLYRLRVNGVIAGFGPGRFVLTNPEFDSYDLTPFLRVGENTILVEANSRGALCYQGEISRGGFIAWGNTSSVDFSTPGDWLCLPTKAWEPNAEPFSFAQGPIEILNQTLLPKGYPAFLNEAPDKTWQKPVEVSKSDHWGKLSARSIPMPTFKPLTAKKISLAAQLEGGRVRYSFNAANTDARVRQAFFTHIYSDKAQEVELGAFWGPLFINGTPVKGSRCEKRGNRENVMASLRAGWNFIYGVPELLQPCWTWLMDHPDNAGLKLRALPDDNCDSAFALGPISRPPVEEWTASIPSSLEQVVNYPKAWKLTPLHETSSSPTREMAWDLVGKTLLKNVPPQKEIELSSQGEGVTVVLDFACEYLGHIFAEFETENGGVVDVGYDELLREDGQFAYYSRNPFVNTVERFVCAPGAGRIDTFHERGGRYIQLTFRGAGKVKIKNVGIIQTNSRHVVEGSFKCADPVLNWTWKAGQETVEAGLADGWVDSPWRERGMYIGDVLVEAAATRKIIRDWSVEAWAVRTFARSQIENGQIRDVAPSNRQDALFDYTLIWVQLLRNYWAETGDTEIIREVWPVIGRVFASSIWKPDANGLWAVEGIGHIFVSWGRHPDEKIGVNGVLNAFRIRALECVAEMAGAIGLAAEKESYAKKASSVREAFRRVFWNKEEKRFGAAIIDGKLSTGPSVHVNTLTLAYGIGDAEQETGILAYLDKMLPKNIECEPGHLDLYFLSYLWTALYRVGRAGTAENLIREHYAPMRDRGAWTLWETLGRGFTDQGSRCHGWSASPVIVFSERTLGVRQSVPGDPSKIIVAPESDTLDWAEGVVPHPKGLIRTSWKIEGDNLKLKLEVPPGVVADVKPAGRLAKLKLVRS